MVLGNLLVDIFELLVVLAAQGNDALIGNVLCIQLRTVDRDGLEGALQLGVRRHVQDGCGRCDLGIVRAAAVVLGDRPVGVHAHEVVGALLCGGGEGEGALSVSRFLVLLDLLPLVVIQEHIQVREGIEVAALEGGTVGLRVHCHLCAGTDAVFVLVEAGKCTAAGPEAPVAVHGHIPGIPVRQHDVVGGGTPAGTHVGIAVIPVIH